jgi:hypothetical protein
VYNYACGAPRTGVDREIKLNELDAALADLDYPVDRAAAVDACGDVTLLLADGTEQLADVVGDSGAERFDSAEDLASEVMSTLPQHAVGEPYQSEGDG